MHKVHSDKMHYVKSYRIRKGKNSLECIQQRLKKWLNYFLLIDEIIEDISLKYFNRNRYLYGKLNFYLKYSKEFEFILKIKIIRSSFTSGYKSVLFSE